MTTVQDRYNEFQWTIDEQKELIKSKDKELESKDKEIEVLNREIKLQRRQKMNSEEIRKQALEEIWEIVKKNPYNDSPKEKLKQIEALIIQMNVDLKELQDCKNEEAND